MHRRVPLLGVATALIAAAPAQARVAVQIGATSAAPGATASIEVTIRTDRDDVSGMANTIGWATPLKLLACRGNPGVAPIASFAFRPIGCGADQSCDSVRALVLSFGESFGDGAVLYHCEIAIAEDAAAGVHVLVCGDAEGGSQGGADLAADCINGAIEVVSPTATPTPPAVSATPTDSPTATAVASSCVGDCDGDRRVTVEELITAVRIALGMTAIGRCAAADADGDAVVAVAELVRGVANALRGC